MWICPGSKEPISALTCSKSDLGIKVIVMSGAATGAINFPILDKPFLGETLMAKIREVLMPPQKANA